ncbi:MAG: HU family DNA-binding protein [Alistipes sp.]|jgi:nucleoid DNA-binding protein|nr:HU family DNA-binding protein [Alistipes sp.]MBQ5922216.1 HU family DNA-binding protein [Alistipes sp.]
MNKSQLINAVAEQTSLSKNDVKKAVDAFFAIAEEKLQQGEKVVVSGFGVFSVAHVAERVGRNPRTGEQVSIPPRRNVRFRSSMDIK